MADETNGKAQRDLRDVQDSINKVELARKQLAELLGEDYEGVGAVETTAAMVGAETVAAGEPATASAEVPEQMVLPGGQPVPAHMQPQAQPAPQPGQQFVSPQQVPPYAQPAATLQPGYAAQSAQPAAQSVLQVPQGQQDGYWRGFQPVPAQPAPSGNMQATQPVPPQVPVYGQQAQPGYTQSTQPVQPAQPVQPVQPAGYSQAYTPQIQQPAGYVPAQDFAVQPQPTTPAYNKSNKSTLAIVLACVIGLLAIIAAIIIGRIISTASSTESTLIDQFTSTEEGYEGENDYYNDHNWGGGNGASSQDDEWGFSWDEGNGENGWDDFLNEDGSIDWDNVDHGAVHVYGGGVDADDGELHDAWDKSVSYSYTEAEFDKEGLETIDFYNKVIAYDFDIEYPQLTGDIPNLETINKEIRDKAMRFVDATYTEPTSDARAMLEAYSADAYGSSIAGVPNGANAILESDVDYAITYNNNDFISICFSDEYAIGSWYGESISLRTVNINLKTGEVYEIDDVLQLNDDIAEDFIQNLSKYDDGSAAAAAGEKSFVGAIQGKGTDAGNVTSTFFVDGNGKANLGVSYFLEGDDAVARGWWDYTLTDAQLEAAKKDSSLWDCLK